MMHPSAPTTGSGVALIVVVAMALFIGLQPGLARLGYSVGRPLALESHGPLLVLGFLGMVIGMEGAIALRRQWVWLVPAGSAGAVVGVLAGLPRPSALLLVASGFGLIGAYVLAHRVQPELHIRFMGLGAVCWLLASSGLLLGVHRHALVPTMAGFLVLTIAGERLELSRLIGVAGLSQVWLMTAVALQVTGAAVTLGDVGVGVRLAGVGLLAAAGWLALNDVARRTIRTAGIARHMAAALLVGYLWLATAGLLWSIVGLNPGQLSYAAAVHSVFLGFVFSMVFAHALVIIPALTGLDFPYSPLFWGPLGLLHVSLLLRVGGDLGGRLNGRTWGGLLHLAAVALFALAVVTALVRERGQRVGVTPRVLTKSAAR